MKFGQYLNENLTPEWRRAYIDYRACKKAIKVVARRLGQLEGDEVISGDQEAPRDVANDAENDSSGDDDYGPSAPPRKSPKSGSRSLRGGKSGAGSGSTSLRSPNPAGTGALTPPTPGAAKLKGLQYGSMTDTPRPLRKFDSNPPPLDLGEAGPSATDESSPELKASLSSTKRPVGPADAVTVPSRNAEQSLSGQGGDMPEPRFQALGQAGSRQSAEDRRSSEEAHTDSSSKPLTGEAGPSKPRAAKNNLKLSPKLTFSPRLEHAFTKSPRNPPKSGPRSLRSLTLPSPRLPLPSPRVAAKTAGSFHELYDDLEEDEQAFFDLLSRELDKVETFYVAREQEAVRRRTEFKDQLTVLAEHRKIYHELYPEGLTEWEASIGRIVPGARGPVEFGHKAAQKLNIRLPFVRSETVTSGRAQNVESKPSPRIGENGDRNGRVTQDLNALREAMIADKDHKTYSPERYTKHKRELRAACQEFYRHLERIKNYRILNMTGFRKALKKFEKLTKIHCMDLWTDEHLSKQAFSSGEKIDDLLKQMEDLYTTHFEHGDSKKARDKLRRQDRNNTHYTTVFRSGFMVGVGLPAAIFALVEAMRTDIHVDLPAWNGLLQVYGALFLPVIFAMLFELNLDAWVSARINYEFVMELSRPVLDFRSYLEIPAFLFATLSFCFYFTYFRVGASNIAPTSWPAIWLVMVAVFFLNPLPVLRRDARYWFLRVLSRVCTPGISRVEFIAFFVADELNSLVYTIQNIFFMSCGYAHQWPDDIFHVCPSGSSWPYALLLCLPALARLLQCVKRWYDTRLRIHLINAGKYFSTICQFIMFVLWRSRGSPYVDPAFFVWIAVAFVNSCYTSTWDLVVDWSLFRPGCKGLRPELGYRNQTLYYSAMVYNVVIRFVWIWYLPSAGRYTRVRSFFFALAEMLRRWIWNFFRVETEHLGNADAYRVTREIPLPYRRIEHDSDSDEPLHRTKSTSSTQGFSLHLAKLRRRFTDDPQGTPVTDPNAAARGAYKQRPYEAWKSSDPQTRNEV